MGRLSPCHPTDLGSAGDAALHCAGLLLSQHEVPPAVLAHGAAGAHHCQMPQVGDWQHSARQRLGVFAEPGRSDWHHWPVQFVGKPAVHASAWPAPGASGRPSSHALLLGLATSEPRATCMLDV